MKKAISVMMCILMLTGVSAMFSYAAETGTTYYFDSVNGNEANSGLSPEKAFAGVESIANLKIDAGDKLLFKKGEVFICDCLELTCSGTQDNPVIISSYGEGGKPLLTTAEKTDILRLYDCSYVTVSELEFTAPKGGGIWIDTLNCTSEGITLDNLTMHNIQNTVATSRDNLSAGPANARVCVCIKGLPARSRYAVNDLTIKNCEMYDCGNGISVWGSWNDEQSPWCDEEDIDPVFNTGLLITDCYFHDMDAEATVIGMCDGALVTNCRCINCCQNDGVNDDGTTFCNAAMWFWGSINSTISRSEISGQKTITDGMTCDFDSYTHYCTYEYIYSHDNARFVANCPQHSGHKGNTIRYCLSVNDNLVENNLSQNCYNSNEYGLKFYNNTIINPGETIIEGVRGGYICDNIFYGDMTSSFRWSRKKVDDSTGKKFMDEFTGVMSNNCFWGTCVPTCANNNYICDPGFTGGDLYDPESYRLASSSKLIGKGITTDCTGQTDLFGNKITSQSNIGCYAGSGEETSADTDVFEYIGKLVNSVFGVIYQFIVDGNNRYWLF